MQNYKNKHVFLLSCYDMFSPLFIDALVEKSKVQRSSILVVYFSTNGRELIKPRIVEGVECISFDDVEKLIFYNAKTITFFSLSSLNSSFVRAVLSLSKDVEKKAYMLVTDDELDRWLTCIRKHGKLVADKDLNIANDDILILEGQLKFIAVEHVFRERFERVFPNKEYELINASAIFDTLYTNASTSLYNSFSFSDINKKKTILIGTKPNAFSPKEIKSIVKSLISRGVNKDYKLIVLWPTKKWKDRVRLELYLLLLHKILRKTVDLSIVTQLHPVAYSAMVMSCTHLFLQPRGGVSTARMYMKFGGGKVFVARESYNEHRFNQAQLIDLVAYSSLDDLVENLEKPIDVLGNAAKINAEELRSLGALAELYTE